MSHRRSQSRPARSTTRIHQRPFGAVRNPYPPLEIVSTDQIEAIHL